MISDSIGFEVQLDSGFEEAIAAVEEALKAEGFGVLTTIDVKKALKEKIGEDFKPYVILGACNPKLAYRALSTNSEVGLMLPCNVTVEEAAGGGTTVRIIKPELMMQAGDLAKDKVLTQVAAEASERLQKVARALE